MNKNYVISNDQVICGHCRALQPWSPSEGKIDGIGLHSKDCCGTKRPEEPKDLGQKIFEMTSMSSQESYDVANKAKEHYFSESNENALAEMLSDGDNWPVRLSVVAKRVCEWFRGIK